jgi:hypothetical protein
MPERFDSEVDLAMYFGQDPAERLADLTTNHPSLEPIVMADSCVPIKEGSRLTNDLNAVAEAREHWTVTANGTPVDYHVALTDEQIEEGSRREGLVDYLSYQCYAHNRRISPHVSPYEWESVFGKDTAKMELRFALEEYARECAETGKVFHNLGRKCDA